MGKAPEAASTVPEDKETPCGWEKEDYRNMVRQGLRAWLRLCKRGSALFLKKNCGENINIKFTTLTTFKHTLVKSIFTLL